jgi:hypothetical protein
MRMLTQHASAFSQHDVADLLFPLQTLTSHALSDAIITTGNLTENWVLCRKWLTQVSDVTLRRQWKVYAMGNALGFGLLRTRCGR